MAETLKRGKLFLSGGGTTEASAEIDAIFVKALKQPSLLYIPIALQRDFAGYEECYDWIISAISKHAENFIDITMWLSLENKNLADLSPFAGVYIGGGNTYELAHEIYRSGFDKVLVSFLKEGGVVYGGSAGAVLMGKRLDIVHEENKKNRQYKEGINLLGNYSLVCHYEPSMDSKTKGYVEKNNARVIAVPEGGGFVSGADYAKVIGSKEVFVFSPGKEKESFNKNDKIKFDY